VVEHWFIHIQRLMQMTEKVLLRLKEFFTSNSAPSYSYANVLLCVCIKNHILMVLDNMMYYMKI
jgi:hypothetical protein